jgi:hypothetical protein
VKVPVIAIAALATLASLVSSSQAQGNVERAGYTVSGTVVVKQAGQPAPADDGVLTCSITSGAGVGGACVSFGHDPGGAAVGVTDDVAGTQVAFQVCLDNDGDGACVSPGIGPCADEIFFSHDDRGAFFNPLGPLPPDFKFGCPGGPWRGYVVFLCAGVHTTPNGTAGGGSPHQHFASQGTVVVTTGGSGFGNFCGGSQQSPSNKRYVLTS